jgi:transposase InsO family protein
MPWQEASPMSLRLEFVTLASVEGANLRQLCRRFAISPKTAYKWLSRFRAGGADALADRSRRPLTRPTTSSARIEEIVLALREQHPSWGGRKLRHRLRTLQESQPAAKRITVPAASTITAILRRHDRLGARAGVPRDWQRFEHDAPNRLWQMDFKGHFAMSAGRCHPLTILDDHSRYALAVMACDNERMPTVRGHLEAVFGRYGLPERILCDNGPPWGNMMADPHTELTVWLLRLGVKVSHGRPCHPQTQGKDERFHRTLAVEVIQGRHFDSLTACQKRFDEWRQVYNHERPHEALAMGVPASRYRPSDRVYPSTLPELEYGASEEVRTVTQDGFVSFRGRTYRIGKGFRGQRVGIRAGDAEGHEWKVFLGVHLVKALNIRQDESED